MQAKGRGRMGKAAFLPPERARPAAFWCGMSPCPRRHRLVGAGHPFSCAQSRERGGRRFCRGHFRRRRSARPFRTRRRFPPFSRTGERFSGAGLRAFGPQAAVMRSCPAPRFLRAPRQKNVCPAKDRTDVRCEAFPAGDYFSSSSSSSSTASVTKSKATRSMGASGSKAKISARKFSEISLFWALASTMRAFMRSV